MTELDQEEREILEAFETGQLYRVVCADETLKRHREYTAAMLRNDARIDVRRTTRDLRGLPTRVLTEGITYQVLASGVLHKYVNDLLYK